jgi:hypothetical protein
MHVVFLGGKCKVNKQLGKPRQRWYCNVEVDLADVAQHRKQGKTALNVVIDHQIP